MLAASGAGLRAAIFTGLIVGSLSLSASTSWEQQRYRREASVLPEVAQIKVLTYNGAIQQSVSELKDFAQVSGADVAAAVDSHGLWTHLAGIDAVYPYAFGCQSAEACDVILFSRTPLFDAQLLPFGELANLRLVTAKTTVHEQIVNLIVAHLSKPYFDEISTYELWQIFQLMAAMDGPIILVGNFNDAPWSHDLNQIIHASRLATPPTRSRRCHTFTPRVGAYWHMYWCDVRRELPKRALPRMDSNRASL